MIDLKLLDAPLSDLEKVRGTITEIERYGIHDGPGIRSIVFLKGCPLRCAWCCNPETQNADIEMAYFEDKCIGCGRCIKECPHGAVCCKDGKIVTDRDICKDKCYGKVTDFPCMKKCYSFARRALGEVKNVLDVYKEVARDQNFYQDTGGGLTISGGEPMMQPEFVYSLLKYCKDKWIDTAMETCGNALTEDYEKVAPYLDVLYMDLKNMDSARHKEWMQRENVLILNNIRRLSELALHYNFKMYVRIPVIPGFNDTEKNIIETGTFIKEECKGVLGMELLPYHNLGRSKYKSLEREYSLNDLQPPENKKMDKFNNILLEMGIKVYQF